MYDRGTPTLQDRFWSRVEKTDTCWLWAGALSSTGYGQIREGGRIHYVHRLSYTWSFGDVPEGTEVCHRCDTPRCVRPDHLFLGTHHENMLDAARKKRVPGNGGQRGEATGTSKLTEREVLEIRASSETIVALALRYGVNHTAISKIRQRLTWRHI